MTNLKSNDILLSGELTEDKKPTTQVDKGYPFYFKDMRNNKILAFRGFIEDINENVNANWGESQYIGRSEPVYTYQNSTRDLNFTFKLFTNSVYFYNLWFFLKIKF